VSAGIETSLLTARDHPLVAAVESMP
jgi:hypothetical protein